MTTPTPTRGHQPPDTPAETAGGWDDYLDWLDGGPLPGAPLPGGADLAELCTSPTDGRICLQIVADRRMTPVCDSCAEQLGEWLASRGVTR